MDTYAYYRRVFVDKDVSCTPADVEICTYVYTCLCMCIYIYMYKYDCGHMYTHAWLHMHTL